MSTEHAREPAKPTGRNYGSVKDLMEQEGVAPEIQAKIKELGNAAPEFKDFGKVYRLSRECVVTEKIDGTNAQIFIGDNGEFLTGSRSRWITPEDDNYGFARWAQANKEELLQLGPGSHFGEWWGHGIARGYGLKEKRFSLFNTSRWLEVRPSCCYVVPPLFRGIFCTIRISEALSGLAHNGSKAAPGFMKPEGIVIYHTAGNFYLKKTIEKDDKPKGSN